MVNESLRVAGMAAGIILLAGAAAWMGLAHGCEKPTGDGRITGQVDIAPELASRVTPTAVLFVIVRRPQGPPRPLAVKRFDAPRFPVTFEITNADVMLKGSELRGMVEVLARLDMDGVAGQAQPGDMEGEFSKNPTLAGSRNLEILINTVR